MGASETGGVAVSPEPGVGFITGQKLSQRARSDKDCLGPERRLRGAHMKATLKDVMAAAAPGAVGSFNVLDVDMALAIADAAETEKRPVIIGVASRHFDVVRAEMFASALLRVAERCGQKVALHLDHATPAQMDMIRRALDAGFTSIMIDGSELPLAKNISASAAVVELCKKYGASVEGELGGIAGEEGEADQAADAPEKLPYTDAAEAARYVRESGVDALAIAVGTAHGIYKAAPEISFSTIEAVAAAVNVPLVLHGATGVREEDIRRCVRLGIRKINFFSGFLQAAMDRLRADAGGLGYDYLKMKTRVADDWRKLAAEQMRQFAG